MTILFLSIEFNYCCGISRSIFSLSKELKKRGYQIILGCPGGTMVNDYILNGLEYVYLPICPDNKKITDAWRCIKTIRNIAKGRKVDIIHSHHRLAELYALIATVSKHTSTVSTAHAIISGKKNLSFRSDKLIAVSDVAKNMLTSDFKVKEKKINVIRNIPRELIKPSPEKVKQFKREIGVSEKDFIIAGVGRLHTEKGFDIFLEALKNVSHLENIKSILVGKGSAKKSLELYSHQNNLDIIFIDETNEVELIYASADVIVIPSRQESAGLVALEAGFFQKPVIASHVGGLKETIKDGITGFSVMPENSMALAGAIEKVYKDKKISRILGKQLFDQIVTEYSVSTIVDQVEAVYNELIADNGRG